MNQDDNKSNTGGQNGIDQETERRNRENETGQQSQQQPQAGQQQPPEAGQRSDSLTTNQAQTGQSQTGQSQTGQSQTGQSQTGQSQTGQSGGQSGDEGGSGFVGSAGDQSSDYLTRGENEDFQPEGQGATDTDAGTSDIETGQSSNIDSTLDDGSDTSR